MFKWYILFYSMKFNINVLQSVYCTVYTTHTALFILASMPKSYQS